jgi:hypothetical protein
MAGSELARQVGGPQFSWQTVQQDHVIDLRSICVDRLLTLGHASAGIGGAQIPAIQTVEMAGDALAFASSNQWQGSMRQTGLNAAPGGAGMSA